MPKIGKEETKRQKRYAYWAKVMLTAANNVTLAVTNGAFQAAGNWDISHLKLTTYKLK